MVRVKFVKFEKTLSLRDALEILGYGPAYHTATMMTGRIEDFAMWSKIADGLFF